MHQIFGKGDYLYSSKYLNDKEMEKGVNIQTYLGREAQHGMLNLSEIRKVPTDPRVLQLSIEQYLTEKEEEETYKQITSISVVRLNTHYTCLTSAFAIFVSEKEINVTKSNALK